MPTAVTRSVGTPDLPALIPSFVRALRALHRSPKTIALYTDAAERLARYLAEQVARYGASAADERAREAHRRLSPVDRL